MAVRTKKAPKKAAAKKGNGSMALVPIGPKGLALPGEWESELESYVSRDAASATGGTGWPFMNTRGGHFAYAGEDIGDEITVIIVGAARVNALYTEKFDAQNPTGPACFAIDKEMDESLMAPPPDLAGKQSETCADCWANAFGSGDTGRGKACKNTVRLCVLPFDDKVKLDKVEGARINISPTSLKAWSAYSSKVTKGLRRPLFTMVTTIRLVPDQKDQFHFEFEPVGAIQDDTTLRTIKARVDGEALTNLYAQPQLAEGDGGGRKKKAPRRKVSKKKSTATAKRRTRARG